MNIKNTISVFVVMILITISNASICVRGEDTMSMPDFTQNHYVIYREASRNNRVELAAFNIDNEDENDCIIFDGALQLFDNTKFKDCTKWFSDGNDWTEFEEGYHCISNFASSVIQSDLKIVEMNNLDDSIEIIQKTNNYAPKKRYWDGKYFVYLEPDNNGGYLINYSYDGVSVNSKTLSGNLVSPKYITGVGNNVAIFNSADFPENSKYQYGTYGNSPVNIYDSDYNYVGSKEFNGYAEYLCSFNGGVYIKVSDYSNISVEDVYGSVPKQPILKYYFTSTGLD